MSTDEAGGSEVLVELYVALLRECNNWYRVQMFVHKPVTLALDGAFLKRTEICRLENR